MFQNKEQLKIDLLRKKLRKGTVTLKYAGSSMHPTLNEGFKLTIEKTSDLKEGDLIAFLQNNKLICHRLIMIRNNKYYAMGDGKEDPDPVIYKKEIFGRVIEVRNSKGKLIPLSKLRTRHLFLVKYYLLSYLMFKKLLSVKLFGLLLRKPLTKVKKKVYTNITRL